MDEKLKPCPFCGGEAFLDEGLDTNGATVYHITCGTCPRTADYSKEDTIEVWNHRASGWRDAKTDPPEDYKAVNVVWVNHSPVPYYADIKDVPQKGTAHYYKPKDCWYWDSPVCEDYLAEYGSSPNDVVAEGVEITHWMPIPEPPCLMFHVKQ